MDPDLALLDQWRAGQQEAGQQLFERHFTGICRFFEHKAAGASDDLVQRTFLACIQARDQFRGHSSFRSYLFTIARHQLYAHYRGQRQNDALDFGVTSLAEVCTTAGARMVRAEEADRMRAALAQLPAEQQLLLEMHYWHDLDAAALAEVFEVPTGTIRVRLSRARSALRAQLGSVAGLTPGDRLAAACEENELA